MISIIILRGILISVLYFEITKTNDTTLENVSLFTLFYVCMSFGALMTGIDPNVVTSAFLSKTVFTIVDERIKKNDNKA